MQFRLNNPTLKLCRTHFYGKQEYLNVPILQVLRRHREFSFEYFITMVKVHLGLHGEAMLMKLDVHDLSYKLDIRNGHFKETARNTIFSLGSR